MRKTQLSCAIVAALASTTLAAQESEAPAKLETIEVTATKRSESIQDVPVAVSALDGKALENLGIDNFQDYVEFLPNVVFQGTGPGQNEIYIRGAATTQSSITLSSVQALQPSVAFYLDECLCRWQEETLMFMPPTYSALKYFRGHKAPCLVLAHKQVQYV